MTVSNRANYINLKYTSIQERNLTIDTVVFNIIIANYVYADYDNLFKSSVSCNTPHQYIPSHYAITVDGCIASYSDESNKCFDLGSIDLDNRSLLITVPVYSNPYGVVNVNDKVFLALCDLCEDIKLRYDIKHTFRCIDRSMRISTHMHIEFRSLECCLEEKNLRGSLSDENVIIRKSSKLY